MEKGLCDNYILSYHKKKNQMSHWALHHIIKTHQKKSGQRADENGIKYFKIKQREIKGKMKPLKEPHKSEIKGAQRWGE